MSDRVVLDCPNVETCGGSISFRLWTENTGDAPHPAYTTTVEEGGQSCGCDLEPEQRIALEDAAYLEMTA